MSNKLFKPSDLYWMGAWLISKISYSVLPIPALMRLAKLKGLFKAFTSKKRFVVRKNIVAVFGDSKTESEIQVIARRYFEFWELFESFFRLRTLKGFARPERWPVEGLQHLDSALAQGKGAIVVITHFGYQRLIKDFLRMRGYKLWMVGGKSSKRMKAERKQKKQLKKFSAFRKFLYDRLRIAVEVTEDRDLLADFNIRPLVEVLKQNGILVLAGDGQYAVKLVNMKFLGRLYPFPAGFVQMAMVTGTPILPAFAVDGPEGFRIKGVIEKPLALEVGGGPEQVAINVQRFANVFESYVRRYPHLYRFWAEENWFEERLARSQKDLAERY